MKFKHFITIIGIAFLMSGCTHYVRTSDTAYPGTGTVFIGVSVDKNDGIKTTTHKEILRPGQKAIFSSEYEFTLVFEDNKSPVEGSTHESKNGIVIIKVPKDILEDKRFIEEFRENDQLEFHYTINAGELSLDPPFFVTR